MKIKSLTIINYRSILCAKDIQLSDKMTILVGKNNEGKSNILRALSGVFAVISLLQDEKIKNLKPFLFRRFRDTSLYNFSYDWEKDFPIKKQKRSPNGKTEFRLNFVLSKEEQIEFAKTTGHRFNENLPFHIIFSKNNVEIHIPKRSYGKSSQSFSQNIDKMAKFISSKMNSIYIPAVRTTDISIGIVEKLIERQVRKVAQEDPEYADAQKKMDELLKKSIANLSEQITDILKKFVPNLQRVEIDYNEYRHLSRRIAAEIKVDDGVLTSIYEKGDGLKSLIALSLMQGSSSNDKDLTIAVEEPESHLHPEACRRVKNILYNLAKQNQVIISTHSPVFINREDLSSNIIVRNNEVVPVHTLSDVRNELGVAISDNLCNAEIILLLEGGTDVRSMSAILKEKSPKLKKAIENGTLIFHAMGGVKNLESSERFFQSLIFKKIVAYVDDDETSHIAFDIADKNGVLNEKDIIFSMTPNKKESEFEDLLLEDLYSDFIPKNLSNWRMYLRNRNQKWSKNIKDLYCNSGTKLDLEELKNKVSTKVESTPGTALDESKSSTIDSLIGLLEKNIT